MSYKARLSRSEENKLNYEVATNADRFDKRLFNSIFKASDNLKVIEKEQSTSVPTTHEFLTDVWSGLYKMNPEVREEVSPELTMNKKLMEHLLNNEDYNNYREYTRLDDLGSVIGATKYSYEALKWLEEEKQGNQDLQDAMDQLQQALQQQGQGQPQQNNNSNGEGDNGQQNPSPVEQAQQALEQALQDALNQSGNKLNSSLAQAGEQAKEDNEQMKSLLGGSSQGNQSSKMQSVPLAERIKLAEYLTKNEKMKRIADWAGRFKAIARQKQKSKSNASHAKGGIEFGNDVENLLPSELLLFSQQSTKLDFLRRFSEQQTLQYQKKGKQTEGKGAIIACLDQSGSMRNEDEMSKGFLLALLMIAKKQRRDFAYIPFSSSVGKVRTFKKGKITTDEMIQIATEFLNGGTDFEEPLNEALSILETSTFKKGDIVFITDGAASIYEQFEERFMRVKKDKEFSMLSLVIGSDNLLERLKERELGRMSDSIVGGNDFTNDKIMTNAFSI